MKRSTRLTAGVLLGTVVLTGCATRKIDPVESGSEPVPGTSWQRFCDGPNGVIWVPGNSGDNDELEAYVYDHPDCAPQYYEQNPGQVPVGPPSDDDGILEED